MTNKVSCAILVLPTVTLIYHWHTGPTQARSYKRTLHILYFILYTSVRQYTLAQAASFERSAGPQVGWSLAACRAAAGRTFARPLARRIATDAGSSETLA